MTGALSQPRPRSLPEYARSILRNPARRISVLLLGAYATGFSGVLLSVVGNPTNPKSVYGAAGILLMGLSFVCLFGLSVTALNTGANGGRG